MFSFGIVMTVYVRRLRAKGIDPADSLRARPTLVGVAAE
jgi:hypothetical protein